MNRITSNAIKCNTCDTTIVSLHRHDFVQCKCPYPKNLDEARTSTHCAVDGGRDYLKRSAGVMADFTELSTFDEEVA